MKKLYPLFLLLFILNKASAQDLIYSPTGEATPAKMVSILADKVKFKKPDNLTGPDYSRGIAKVLIAFNASGDYLVFNDKTTLTDDEKNTFLNPTPGDRSADILVDVKGGVLNMNITDDKSAYFAGIYKGKKVKAAKASLIFVIHKNGTHQFFVTPDKAAGYLTNAKAKINELLASGTTDADQPTVAPAAPAATVITSSTSSDDMAIDMNSFKKKAMQKTEDFKNYLNAICAVNKDRDMSNKSIDLAVDLFVNEDAMVEISSVNTEKKPQYKIRTYLTRLQLRSSQYDKVEITYANMNYASKFTKGADGNYYAVLTFVQQFKGFIDGKMVYGDRTKRNITVELKQIQKIVDGESKNAWDVLLDNVGVVETKKI